MRSKKIGDWTVNLFEEEDSVRLKACYMSNACTHVNIYNIKERGLKDYNEITSQKELYKKFPEANTVKNKFLNWLKKKK